MGIARPAGPRLGSAALGWLLLALSLVTVVWIGTSRRPPAGIWGDEGTYLAMTASLVRDGDLEFAASDRRWAEERRPAGGVALILQRTADGISYSKPVIYPLLGAPFYALAGERGLVIFNCLALTLAATLAWRYLRRRGFAHAWLLLATFLGAGALLPYLRWGMPEILQLSLALAGLVLCCGALRPPAAGTAADSLLDRSWAPVVGAVLLGLLVGLRAPHALVALSAVAAAMLAGRHRRALTVLLVVAGVWLGTRSLTDGLLGAPDPYRARRSSFTAKTGYPIGPGAAAAAERFDEAPATNLLALRPAFDGTRSAYSTLYSLVGRHTGLLVYFPAVLLALPALRRADRVGLAMLAGAAALMLFYLVWMPWNYFGGSTFLGNRYFLAAYPALLLALPAAPPRGWLAAIWLLAVAAAVSAAGSVRATAERDVMSQSHASAGLYRGLPYESTARDIDGRRDRYWAGDFLRFVDPWARVGNESFVLRSSDPAAEVLIAAGSPGGVLLFEARSEAPRAGLEFRDWAARSSHALAADGAGSRAVLAIPASPAWRRHRFWWHLDAVYRVYVVRLRARGDGPGAVAVELRYLGRRAESPDSGG